MGSMKKYGSWILMGLGAVLLAGWAYTKFVKGGKPGFGAPDKAA